MANRTDLVSARAGLDDPRPHPSSPRREFLKAAGALTAAGLIGVDPTPAAADPEPPPETTRLRLVAVPAICLAPQYVAEALLKSEGFIDVEYVKFDMTFGNGGPIASGRADLTLDAAGDIVTYVDKGVPVVTLGGVHLGCYELFGTERVRAIRDLKGRTIAVDELGGPQHVFLSSMLAYVGLDPRKDISWLTGPSEASMQHFIDGKADAFLGLPPQPQELRARKIGHVVVNTATDRPWAQYYCCMLTGSREFVERNPIATKRAMRAIFKAADLCAQQPERAARMMVDRGFAKRYDFALETLKDVRYNAWRTYDPDNTIRFHALRLHEVGMIKTPPEKIIAKGTDWRFLNELKKELKA